jgi:hypothetical protein
MPTNPTRNPSFDAKILEMLDQLACPACLGNLCLETETLLCLNCSRAYPIFGGIPVLIADRGGAPA